MLSNILTKGEEELLTANLSQRAKQAVIKWAKQTRLDNYLLSLAINQNMKVAYKDNPGIFFGGEGKEISHLIELRKNIV